jgi:crossover junction endodeoxyribonuclease RusA
MTRPQPDPEPCGVHGTGAQMAGRAPNQQPMVFDLKVPLLDEKPPLTANMRLHWHEDAKRRRVVREAVAWAAKAEKVRPQMHIVVGLHYAPQDRRRRDPSNLMATQKPAVDGLVDAGVVPDDTPQFVTELMPVIHAPDGDAKRMWLRVEVHR